MIIHHHHHRFEKKIKIRERSQRRSILFYETTAEHIRWKKQTHPLLGVVVKRRQKTPRLKRKKEKE